MKEPLLKTAMTPFPYSVAPSATLPEAVALMQEHRVRHLPVTQDHQLVGLISDRDIKARLAESSDADARSALRVSDVCIDECYHVDLDQPLHSVLRTMADRHIGSAVVTAHGRLAGMFTLNDACRAFADHLDAQFRPGQGRSPRRSLIATALCTLEAVCIITGWFTFGDGL